MSHTPISVVQDIVDSTNPSIHSWFYDQHTKNSGWTKAGNLIFPGVQNDILPQKIYVIAWIDPGGTQFGVRIRDVTNRTTIAQDETLTGTNEEISIDMGTLANIPLTRATWQIQIRKIAGDANARVHAEYIHISYLAG